LRRREEDMRDESLLPKERFCDHEEQEIASIGGKPDPTKIDYLFPGAELRGAPMAARDVKPRSKGGERQ